MGTVEVMHPTGNMHTSYKKVLATLFVIVPTVNSSMSINGGKAQCGVMVESIIMFLWLDSITQWTRAMFIFMDGSYTYSIEQKKYNINQKL